MDEMEHGFAHFRFQDLLRISDLLDKKTKDLETQLLHLKRQIKTIESVLAQNKNRDETYGVYLPKRFFDLPDTKGGATKSGAKKVFNWKSVALEIVNDAEGLMTTDMVYERARMLHPLELTDRSEAIRNFSSALYYLNRNVKICRYKEDGSKEYLYGHYKYFDIIKQQPKTEYMEKFRKNRR